MQNSVLLITKGFIRQSAPDFFFFLKSDIQVLVIYLSLLTLEVVFRLLEEPSLGHMLKVNLRYI